MTLALINELAAQVAALACIGAFLSLCLLEEEEAKKWSNRLFVLMGMVLIIPLLLAIVPTPVSLWFTAPSEQLWFSAILMLAGVLLLVAGAIRAIIQDRHHR